tara:strand:+ start:644 stop:886 length:243 start_codon:yes stop_codon:yes gene_type:complete
MDPRKRQQGKRQQGNIQSKNPAVLESGLLEKRSVGEILKRQNGISVDIFRRNIAEAFLIRSAIYPSFLSVVTNQLAFASL